MHIKILDRPSAQTLTVYWSDPQTCHYQDQLWRLAHAKAAGSCALSRLLIKSGEPVYRPKKRGGLTPANHNAMIAAASLMACQLDDDMEN